MKETDLLDEYILQHIDEEGEYLKSLYRDTHVKLLRPRIQRPSCAASLSDSRTS